MKEAGGWGATVSRRFFRYIDKVFHMRSEMERLRDGCHPVRLKVSAGWDLCDSAQTVSRPESRLSP